MGIVAASGFALGVSSGLLLAGAPRAILILSTSRSSDDEETDEGAGDQVDERQHWPIVPGRSERESGFPIPTGPGDRDAYPGSEHQRSRRARDRDDQG